MKKYIFTLLIILLAIGCSLEKVKEEREASSPGYNGFSFRGMKFGDMPPKWMADFNPPDIIRQAGYKVLYEAQTQTATLGDQTMERQLFVYKDNGLVEIESISPPFTSAVEADAFAQKVAGELNLWRKDIVWLELGGKDGLPARTLGQLPDATIEIRSRKRAGCEDKYEVSVSFRVNES